MKLHKFFPLLGVSMLMAMSSCVGDLNVEPTDPSKKTELNSKEEYLEALAGAYYGLAKEGGITSGATGGESVYTRILFNLQELPTDEVAICGNWNDAGIDDLVYAIPAADNHWIYDMYSRINAHIAVCNQFLRDISNAGDFFTENEIAEMKAEVRVLRDLGYYHIIDIFGVGPWTDENSIVGATPPTYTRAELYEAVVEDLLDAIPLVTPAAQQQYGRISREAGLALLAKMYLNAGVYTGTPAWNECANTCQQILATVSGLTSEYKYLFCGSNSDYVACAGNDMSQAEILWSVPQNYNTMQNWGGTTYLSVGAYSSADEVEQLRKIMGCTAGPWQGPHMRPETVNNFEANDKRAMFYGDIFELDLHNMQEWGDPGTSGYMCIKYVFTPASDYYNQYNAETGEWGEPGTGTSGSPNDYNSCDYPLFRLGDIYLMLVECEMNGVNCNAITYYNAIRQRAGLSPVGSIPSSARELLNERNRELYWEGHRRSDMIRLGLYTGSAYNWQWKSGVFQGGAIESFRTLMPIPPEFVSTLGQNPGY